MHNRPKSTAAHLRRDCRVDDDKVEGADRRGYSNIILRVYGAQVACSAHANAVHQVLVSPFAARLRIRDTLMTHMISVCSGDAAPPCPFPRPDQQQMKSGWQRLSWGFVLRPSGLQEDRSNTTLRHARVVRSLNPRRRVWTAHATSSLSRVCCSLTARPSRLPLITRAEMERAVRGQQMRLGNDMAWAVHTHLRSIKDGTKEHVPEDIVLGPHTVGARRSVAEHRRARARALGGCQRRSAMRELQGVGARSSSDELAGTRVGAAMVQVAVLICELVASLPSSKPGDRLPHPTRCSWCV